MMPFLFFLFATAENPEWVQIQLSFDRAANHLIEVVAEYPPANTSQRTLNMPVWTPGSYKIRDYARNVQGFEATSLEGNPLQWTKTEKSAWQIRVPIQTGFRVRYQIYAFEESVRTNFVNSEGGYVNPAATFMYEKGAKRSYRILFKTPKTWQVHSGLSSLAPNLFEARSLDSLMDCPYLLGPTTLLQFTVRSIPFRFAYLGQPNVDMPKLLGDIQKIAQETVDLFGSAPFQNYIFLCVFRNGPARGGLEHRNSTLFLSESNRFLNEKGRTGFLSLVAHELFHAWNVKAMRDEGIWNFDYQTENYTRLLWVHEGWTSYYDDLILVRTGLMDVKKWWEKQAKTIQTLEESAAPKVESLTDASFDAWIHNYQPNGNAHNAQVDYYDQGALSALALDLYLRSRSQNKLSLDQLITALYRDYAQQNKPISIQAIYTWLDTNMDNDAVLFLKRNVEDPKLFPFKKLLQDAGYQLGPKPKKADNESDSFEPDPLTAGFKVVDAGGRCMIGRVEADSPAWEAGLSAQDEVLALNGRRVLASSFEETLKWFQAGQTIEVLFVRDSLIGKAQLALSLKPQALSIEPAAELTESHKAIQMGLTQSKTKP